MHHHNTKISFIVIEKQLTSLCPAIVFSNLPSYAPQIFISLSAAKIKKSSKNHDNKTNNVKRNLSFRIELTKFT